MTLTKKYEDYSWIKVKNWKEDESKSLVDNYANLKEHHIKETTFLIDEVRKLAKEIDEMKRLAHG